MDLRNRIFIIIALLVTLLLSACKPMTSADDGGEDTVKNEDSPAVVEEKELFSESSSAVGEYVLRVNDTKYITPKGYTIWREMQEKSGNGTFSCEVNKVSGASEYGYGILFNIHEDNDGNKNMLCFMITITGKYCVGKVVNGIYSEIENWTDCKSLNRGFGNSNILSVKFVEESREFILIINDTECTKLSNPTGFLLGDKGGVCAVISPYEAFPKTKVEVHYKRR